MSKLRQHSNDSVDHIFGFSILLRSESTAHFQDILRSCTFQRRTTSDLEEPSPVGLCGLAIALDYI